MDLETWDARDFLMHRGKQEYLIDGILLENAQAMLWAPTGHLKSFVAVDLACHIASGRSFHGREVKQGDVVYVASEAPQEIAKRIVAWEDFHGVKAGVKLVQKPFHLKQDADISSLIRHIESTHGRTSLVIFDTAERVSYGIDENHPASVNEHVNKPLDRVRAETGATTLLVHHASAGRNGQGANPRGCTAWTTPNDTIIRVDSVFAVKRNNDTPVKTTLQVTKQRGDAVTAVPFTPIKVDVPLDKRGTLILTPFVETAEKPAAKKRETAQDRLGILFTDQDTLTTQQVADALYDGKLPSARQILGRAKKNGLVEKQGENWVSVTA